MKVLVTGASGFVGTALCRRLVANGWPVVGAMRQVRPLPEGVEPCLVAPLGPATNWTAALEGAQAVVHLAARVHVMRETAADPEAQYRTTNVDGTLRLAREAAAAGVRRLVFMSSAKVNGEASGATPFTLDAAPAPADAYGRSKWQAEQGLAELVRAGDGHFRVTILRPPLVYGPGVGGNFLHLLRAMWKGWPLPLAGIDNRRSLVYVENLADAVVAALAGEAGACETFLVCDGEDVATPDLLRRLARAMGRPSRLWSVPPSWLMLAGHLAGRGAAVSRLTESLQVDCAAFRARFGWSPPHSLDHGVNETASWYLRTMRD